MNTSKLDLDGLLKDWPAPVREDAAWEAQADQIVELARARRLESTALAAILDPPELAPEPGEPDSPAAQAVVGDGTNMSQESDEGRASKPETSPPAARTSDRKRPSLKAIAERASQTGRVSAVPGMGFGTPPPSGRGSMPPARNSSAPSGRGSFAPGRGSFPGRALESGKDDSGVVDLNVVQATATPEQKAAADKAMLATADLFEDDEKPIPVAAVSAPSRASAAAPAAAAAKKGTSGVVVGGVIALVGLAAAFAIMRAPKEPSAASIAPAPAAPPAVVEQKIEAKPVEVAAAPAEPEKPASAAGPKEKTAEAPRVTGGGAAVAAAAAPEAPAATGTPKAEPEKVAEATPAPPKKPGDLSSAMQTAVGPDGTKSSAVSETPEPAAGKRDQNIPEQPSQGSVQAAVGSVMPGAKACVSGASDVSRAQITFSSAGSVSNVSVTGWAASNGQTACVKGALKPANVGAFSKSSFSVGVTIRP